MKLPISADEYYLTKPEQFEKKNILIEKIPREHTVLQTLYTAICGSDLQYYKGEKSEEKLRTRLPLIPLHEGVCLDLKTGKRVVPIAGDFRKVPYAFFRKENTWPQLPYLGSTMPGLSRTHFIYPTELLVPVPKSIPDTVASIVEPLSIALKSCSEMTIKKNEPIAIIGTGGVAFLLGMVLRYFFHIPKKNLSIFGVNDEKLQAFSTLATTINYLKNDNTYDHTFAKVFEAVGRTHMKMTMDTAMKLIRPGGTIGVLGISDKHWVLPIEQLVNRQITVKGLTRSTPADYPRTMRFLQKESISKIIENHLISPHIFTVTSEKDLNEAFDFAGTSKAVGRILLKWS
ncbi:alcohol dehydrogenase catalytic domain-containing protein [soil metagenome]